MLELITDQLYFQCTQESKSAQFFTIPEDNEVPAVPKYFSIVHITLLLCVQDLKALEVSNTKISLLFRTIAFILVSHFLSVILINAIYN